MATSESQQETGMKKFMLVPHIQYVQLFCNTVSMKPSDFPFENPEFDFIIFVLQPKLIHFSLNLWMHPVFVWSCKQSLFPEIFTGLLLCARHLGYENNPSEPQLLGRSNPDGPGTQEKQLITSASIYREQYVPCLT